MIWMSKGLRRKKQLPLKLEIRRATVDIVHYGTNRNIMLPQFFNEERMLLQTSDFLKI